MLLDAILFGLLVYQGKITINHPSEEDYPIRGVDVSYYQGEIDWGILAEENIDFAFIKATEGSSHIDTKFKENWEQSGKTRLKRGAYHFFSFDSNGEAQAEHFISVVPKEEGMLFRSLNTATLPVAISTTERRPSVMVPVLSLNRMLRLPAVSRPLIFLTRTLSFAIFRL